MVNVSYRLSPNTKNGNKANGRGTAGRPITVLSPAGSDHLKNTIRNVNCAKKHGTWRALVDRGANGCIAGNDTKLIEFTGQNADLSGIDDHTIRNLKIAKVGGVTKSSIGDIIVIINQAAYMPDGRTILSTGQLEYYKTKVNDKSKKITGKTPSIITLEKQEIPMETRKGLPYISLRPGTDEEWKTLPKVEITSPFEWDPTVLDCRVSDEWYKERPKIPLHPGESKHDEEGDLVPPDPEEEEDLESDDEDRRLKTLNRGGIKTFLTKLVKDEIVREFTVCNVEGFQHELRHKDRWDERISDDESCTEVDDVPPLMTRDDDSSDEEDDELWMKWQERVNKRRQEANVSTRSQSRKEPVTQHPRTPTTTKPQAKGKTRKRKKKKRKEKEKVEHAPSVHFDDHVDEPRMEEESDDIEHPHLEFNNRARTLQEIADEMGQDLDEPNPETGTRIAGIEPRLSTPRKEDVAEHSKYFPGTDSETPRKTFDATTQCGNKGATQGHSLRNQIKSPNPILNIK